MSVRMQIIMIQAMIIEIPYTDWNSDGAQDNFESAAKRQCLVAPALGSHGHLGYLPLTEGLSEEEVRGMVMERVAIAISQMEAEGKQARMSRQDADRVDQIGYALAMHASSMPFNPEDPNETLFGLNSETEVEMVRQQIKARYAMPLAVNEVIFPEGAEQRPDAALLIPG